MLLDTDNGVSYNFSSGDGTISDAFISLTSLSDGTPTLVLLISATAK